MPGNSFGELFRVTTAGVSHGPGYLVIIDGCPPGLPLSVDDLLPDLRRRRPGQSKIVTQRQEEDLPEIWSGVFEGKTDGTSIGILFRNTDQRSQRLQRHQGQVSSRTRRLHLRRQVRLPRLPRRRPLQRPRDRLPRGRRGRRQEAAGPAGHPRSRLRQAGRLGRRRHSRSDRR